MNFSHLAVYHVFHSGLRQHGFAFFAGKKAVFPEKISSLHDFVEKSGFGKLKIRITLNKVAVKTLHPAYRVAVNNAGRKTRTAFLKLGQITFLSTPEVNVSVNYRPKSAIGARVASGFGAYLEALAVSHLKKLKVRKFQTSCHYSEAREAQLKKGKLTVLTPYRTKTWLKGMGRIVKTGLSNRK